MLLLVVQQESHNTIDIATLIQALLTLPTAMVLNFTMLVQFTGHASAMLVMR
jgi:hypothetical protein